MPWDVQYVAGKETLVVTTAGQVSDQEAKELTARAIVLLKETRATRVLGDCRRMASSPSLATVWWLVNDYASHGVPRQTRIAVVQADSPLATEFGQFYETVCLNRRYQAKVFYSPEDAEAWLLSGSSA